MPVLGDCAVRHMGAVIARIEARLFPALAGRRTAMPVVPEGARQSTLNINSVHGGAPEEAVDDAGLPSPCVPDRCRKVIGRRFLMEEDIADVAAEVRALLEGLRRERPGFACDLREIHRVLPTMTDRDSPVAAAVARGIGRIPGREAQFVVSPGTYDQKHIDRIGRMKNCIACGPGILDLAHKPDEHVAVADLVPSARVIARAPANLLDA